MPGWTLFGYNLKHFETEKVGKPPKPALLYIVENIPIGDDWCADINMINECKYLRM